MTVAHAGSASLYPTVRAAGLTTARSSLDLLELPYPFSQVHLLTVSEFAGMAGKRRGRAGRRLPPVNEQVLEELHRCGVLVPLFRVDLEHAPDARAIDVSASVTPSNVHATIITELYRAAEDMRLMDPGAAGFAPWPKERQRTLWPGTASGYLYSRYQLLGLETALGFVADLKGRVADGLPEWFLDEADQPNTPTVAALASWRSLAICLSALDTYYWPQMARTLLGDIDTWRTVFTDRDPARMLDWLGASLEQVERQVTDLQMSASSCDDTGDFYDLIRRAKAEAWNSLRGDAAVAMDYRLAADILTRFAEDIRPSRNDDTGALPPPLSQQGLSARPQSLDAALTRLHLSPFPALVIGVEGETEYRLVPRVMDMLGIAYDRNRIVIVDYGGTGNLALLARYAGEPVLGRDYGKGVALDRPLTRFLVLADAENNYKTAADRRRQRRLLLESLTRNVPKDLRADYYVNTRRARIVEIRTWGRLPFEFAHFTDMELADAILAVAQTPHPRGRAQLLSDLRRQRGRSAPDVSKVYRWHQSGLSKPLLADALWPVLERKIQAALDRGTPGPPVLQACIRAYEMAAVSEKVSIMLRRRRWRPRK